MRNRNPRARATLVLGMAAAAAIVSPRDTSAYSAGDTFDLKLAVNFTNSAYGNMGHMQAGETDGRARLWLGRADMQLEMHPLSGFSTSVVRSTTGSKHAGYGEPTAWRRV